MLKETILFIRNAVVAVAALILSVPFIFVGVFCWFGGREDYGDWMIDNSPLSLWLDYIYGGN